jgi:hypothetical protein
VGDGVDTLKRTQTPSQIQVGQALVAQTQMGNAAAQAQGAGSVFDVREPVAQRADVKALLDGSRVTAQDLNKLFSAGVDPQKLDSELIQNGDGKMAYLLTPEAMQAVLQRLPAGDHTFLAQGSATLPPGISVKMAETKLAERGEATTDAQMQSLINQGMLPQDALRAVLSQIDPAPVEENTLPTGTSTRPAPPSLADPKGDNAQLQQLLGIPAFQSAYLATSGRAVTAQDMTAMINAVGPQGLKALGSAVVFGSGGIADRLMPEAMTTFLQAVHTQSMGATAGGVPTNAYAGTSQWQGPAATANTPQGFLRDPGLQYLGQAYPNGWGAFAGGAALSMTAANLMPYANNFMYGGMYNTAMYNPYLYSGMGAYMGGLYGGNMFYGGGLSTMLGAAAGAAVGTLAMDALGFGFGYGGLYGGAGMWGLGNAYWNMYPGNMFGYEMMYGGWPYAMSWW